MNYELISRETFSKGGQINLDPYQNRQKLKTFIK